MPFQNRDRDNTFGTSTQVDEPEQSSSSTKRSSKRQQQFVDIDPQHSDTSDDEEQFYASNKLLKSRKQSQREQSSAECDGLIGSSRRGMQSSKSSHSTRKAQSNKQFAANRQEEQDNAQGFYFKPRREKLNWRVLSQIDTEQLMDNVDIDTLESITRNLTFSKIDRNDLHYFSEDNFVHLFQLCQLVIEYLLYVQDFLVRKRQSVESDVETILTDIERYREALIKKTEENSYMKRDVKRLKRTIFAYQLVFGANPEKAKIMLSAMKAGGQDPLVGMAATAPNPSTSVPVVTVAPPVPSNIQNRADSESLPILGEIRAEMHRLRADITELRSQVKEDKTILSVIKQKESDLNKEHQRRLHDMQQELETFANKVRNSQTIQPQPQSRATVIRVGEDPIELPTEPDVSNIEGFAIDDVLIRKSRDIENRMGESVRERDSQLLQFIDVKLQEAEQRWSTASDDEIRAIHQIRNRIGETLARISVTSSAAFSKRSSLAVDPRSQRNEPLVKSTTERFSTEQVPARSSIRVVSSAPQEAEDSLEEEVLPESDPHVVKVAMPSQSQTDVSVSRYEQEQEEPRTPITPVQRKSTAQILSPKRDEPRSPILQKQQSSLFDESIDDSNFDQVLNGLVDVDGMLEQFDPDRIFRLDPLNRPYMEAKFPHDSKILNIKRGMVEKDLHAEMRAKGVVDKQRGLSQKEFDKHMKQVKKERDNDPDLKALVAKLRTYVDSIANRHGPKPPQPPSKPEDAKLVALPTSPPKLPQKRVDHTPASASRQSLKEASVPQVQQPVAQSKQKRIDPKPKEASKAKKPVVEEQETETESEEIVSSSEEEEDDSSIEEQVKPVSKPASLTKSSSMKSVSAVPAKTVQQPAAVAPPALPPKTPSQKTAESSTTKLPVKNTASSAPIHQKPEEPSESESESESGSESEQEQPAKAVEPQQKQKKPTLRSIAKSAAAFLKKPASSKPQSQPTAEGQQAATSSPPQPIATKTQAAEVKQPRSPTSPSSGSSSDTTPVKRPPVKAMVLTPTQDDSFDSSDSDSPFRAKPQSIPAPAAVSAQPVAKPQATQPAQAAKPALPPKSSLRFGQKFIKDDDFDNSLNTSSHAIGQKDDHDTTQADDSEFNISTLAAAPAIKPLPAQPVVQEKQPPPLPPKKDSVAHLHPPTESLETTASEEPSGDDSQIINVMSKLQRQRDARKAKTQQRKQLDQQLVQQAAERVRAQQEQKAQQAATAAQAPPAKPETTVTKPVLYVSSDDEDEDEISKNNQQAQAASTKPSIMQQLSAPNPTSRTDQFLGVNTAATKVMNISDIDSIDEISSGITPRQEKKLPSPPKKEPSPPKQTAAAAAKNVNDHEDSLAALDKEIFDLDSKKAVQSQTKAAAKQPVVDTTLDLQEIDELADSLERLQPSKPSALADDLVPISTLGSRTSPPKTEADAQKLKPPVTKMTTAALDSFDDLDDSYLADIIK